MKNKYLNFNSILRLIFVLVSFLIVVYASMGLEFSFDKLIDLNFWFVCVVKLFVVLAIHNTISGTFSGILRGNEDSKYFVTLATNRLRVDEVYKQNDFSKLDKAIREENDDEYKSACNSALRNVTTRMSYSDLDLEGLSKEKIKDTCEKYMLNWWQSFWLKRAILKIAKGKIKYDVLVPDHILKDKDSERDKPISAAFNMSRFIVKQNRNKVITFVVSTVAMTIVSFGQTDMTIWQALLTNSILLLSSVISGVTMATSYIKTRTLVFEQRNRFLARRMGINIEYLPTKKQTK